MPIFSSRVPIYNGDMTELCPVSQAKARILIRNNKAKVICTHPFTIRLNRVIVTTKRDKEIISIKTQENK